MSSRLWYPQLDIYDCVRRMSCILNLSPSGMFRERLFILDFFFANPSLLHKTKMKQEVRSKFRDLGVTKPEKEFLIFPATKLLFHQMEAVQKDAVSALTGKGLVEQDDNNRSFLSLSDNGMSIFVESINVLIPKPDNDLAEFLVHDFGAIGEDGMKGLRDSTGLRRAG